VHPFESINKLLCKKHENATMQDTQRHDVIFTLDKLTSPRTPSVHVRCTLRTMLPSWCHVRLSWVCVSSGNGANNASPKAANTCQAQ